MDVTIPSGTQWCNDYTQPAHALFAALPPIPSTPYGVTTIYQLTHALAARPTREMTLDCRTLWSVRFCAAKGHFCSLLLSNILVTSAFCRLTISPICFHSIFPVFSLLSLYAGCSYRLEFVSIDKPPCRFFWNSGIRFSLITLNNSTSLLLFRKNGGRKSFLYERCFPFVTIYYHDFFSFSSRNVVQSI